MQCSYFIIATNATFAVNNSFNIYIYIYSTLNIRKIYNIVVFMYVYIYFIKYMLDKFRLMKL